MTIKQAVAFLKARGIEPNSLNSIRAAIKANELEAELITDTPSPYYVVTEDALLKWANNPDLHRRGNPNWRKD